MLRRGPKRNPANPLQGNMSMASFTLDKNESLQWSREDWIFLAAILAVTFLCYLPSLGYEFVYDDRLLILRNPAILSWKSAAGFFSRDFTSVAIPEALEEESPIRAFKRLL